MSRSLLEVRKRKMRQENELHATYSLECCPNQDNLFPFTNAGQAFILDQQEFRVV